MTEEKDTSKKISRKKTIIISLSILAVAAIVTAIIFMTEPTATRVGASKETAMLVDVIEVDKGTYQPTIIATGNVVPSQDVILSPRVSGEVIRRSSSFIPGGFVSKGEVLLQIDPTDYRNNLQLRKSELQQAQADLSMEMGRQDVAQKDYELLDESLSEENRALVLRQPQLQSAQSSVEAAQANVEQAEVELRRTTIRAPFNAHILNRNVNVGSLVSPGETLGRLVGMDTYWVETAVPLSNLRWLSFPDNGEQQASNVKIRNRTAWPENEYREGYLFKLIGALEEEIRMARVLIAVPDPLNRRNPSDEKPVLMIGAFVETSIQANEIDDVVRLNRDFVRQNETVWVMEKDSLLIKDIDIIFRDSKYVYITSGLEEDDKVITTNLATVVEGSKLRLSEAGPAGDTVTTQTKTSE